jgi:hypothetical protein
MRTVQFNIEEYFLGKETEFGKEISNVALTLRYLKGFWLSGMSDYIKAEKIIEVVEQLKLSHDSLNVIDNFLLKYDGFFEILDKKFGKSISKSSELSKRIIGDMKNEIDQIIAFVSNRKFNVALEIFGNLLNNLASLEKEIGIFVTIPYIIDYSKLSPKDWKMIGVAGIHYRSKVFLSYHFRDDDPKEDENQKMIDFFVKPVFELLDIEPVTARSHLKPQELVDDKIMELVEDCDGIIGFYTKGDSVENVEHELSGNSNVIAICKEEGAKAPSMRLSRLLINFKRDAIGDFLIELIRTLRDKGLFRLMI